MKIDDYFPVIEVCDSFHSSPTKYYSFQKFKQELSEELQNCSHYSLRFEITHRGQSMFSISLKVKEVNKIKVISCRDKNNEPGTLTMYTRPITIEEIFSTMKREFEQYENK